MSYDIYIGNAELEEFNPDDDECNTVRVHVDQLNNKDAPVFPNDEMTGDGNDRHPGYNGWATFCEDSGLEKLFFDEETGLMRQHPGVFHITKNDLAVVQEKLELWKSSHPNAVPGFGGMNWSDGTVKEPNKYDPVLARLIWLEWWMRYALKNCKTPAIENS